MNENETITEWNRAAEATFGWQRAEVLGKTVSDLIVPLHLRAAHREGMASYLGSGENRVLGQRLQLSALHRKGYEFPVEMTITEVRFGKRRVFNAFLHDISERVAREARLRDSEQQLRTVADNVPALIGHVGADLRYRFVNRAHARHFGMPSEAIVGRHLQEILCAEYFEAIQPRVAQVLAGQTVVFDADLVSADGKLHHMQVTYVPDFAPADGPGNAAPRGFHILVHDLTAKTRLSRMIEQRALTDALTGLPNRAAWNAELERGIARAQRAGTAIAVMFIDLDGFKQINDTFGHEAGDAVLREFSRRLKATLRSSDFIARLAGDEFVVWLDRSTDAAGNLSALARKLLKAMEKPVDLGGNAVTMKASIGLAAQPGPQLDAAALMRAADEAMYRAKRSGTAHFHIAGSSDVVRLARHVDKRTKPPVPA